MATTLTPSHSYDFCPVINDLLTMLLPATADLFQVADLCSDFVIRRVESDDTAGSLVQLSRTLPDSVTVTLTGLLHDLVILLTDYLKQPYIRRGSLLLGLEATDSPCSGEGIAGRVG